jgi:hypothetical protein
VQECSRNACAPLEAHQSASARIRPTDGTGEHETADHKMKHDISIRFALLSWFVWALKGECRKAYRNRELSVKTRAPKGLLS